MFKWYLNFPIGIHIILVGKKVFCMGIELERKYQVLSGVYRKTIIKI